MSMQEFLINFLSIILGLIAFYIFKGYWPKYFEAKGTNQATKEDIGEITGIVENIKSDLLHQNELIKAQLLLSNQHKINLKTAEREAIFEYNKRISAWMYSLMRFKFSAYDLENYKDLKLRSSEFAQRLYECDLAEAHLILFMHDDEFLKIKLDLTLAILALEEIVEKSMLNIYGTYSSYELKLGVEKENFQRLLEIKSEMFSKLLQLTQDHLDNTVERYKKVHQFHSQMTQLINARLKQLED